MGDDGICGYLGGESMWWVVVMVMVVMFLVVVGDGVGGSVTVWVMMVYVVI